jgi:hypothetical protein
MDQVVPNQNVVFYPLRRGILVTDGWFCSQRFRLAVGDIGDIGWRQSGHRVTRHTAGAVIVTETVLLFAIAFIGTAAGGPSIAAFVLASLYLPVALMLIWLSAYRYPGPLQLWAQHLGGQQVLLFSSSDQTEFHKVRRALERAVEYHQDLVA